MEQVIELGSFWLIKDSGCIATVKSIVAKANGGATVVYTITDNSGVSSYRMSCEYGLFTNIAEKFITKSELKDELNTEYVKGKTDGYNEGYQHGFTLAKEKITDLDEEERVNIYNEGYNDGKCFGINLGKNDTLYQKQWVEAEKDKSYKVGYKDGHNDCSEELHSHMSEKELECKKQGFEDGYNTAIKEMKSDKLNSGVCGSNIPNKETQEAMQEVLDKVSKKHSHYFKDTSMFDEIDTYLLARIWNIEDKNGAYFHAFKKVLDAGKRGNKGKFKDIGEAIDSLKRYLEIERLFEDKGDD